MSDDRWIDPKDRWKGDRIWFGYVVKWGRLDRSAVRGLGVDHLYLNDGHYFTLELWRLGFYLTWFGAW